MNKLQIQLPSPLYKQLKQLAKRLDYSMAELLRRGAEHIVILYPHHQDDLPSTNAWALPKPKKMGLNKLNASQFRQIAHERK